MKRRCIQVLLLAAALVAGCRHKTGVVVLEASSADFGTQLRQAMDSCPVSAACTIDARAVTGAQTSAQSIVLDRPLTVIEVGFSGLTLAPGRSLRIAANYVTIQGPSMSTSTLQCQSGNAPCVYIGTRDTAGIYAPVLRDLAIRPVSGTTGGAAGIEIENARGPGALLSRLNVDGFPAGLRVLENAWTWDVEDSQFVNGTHGAEFLGDQPNAWVLTHNLFNSNSDAGVWIKLCDYPGSYGTCTTNGMTFANGNHFEANGSVGFRLVNGMVYNLVVRDSYGELTQSGTGYFTAQNDGTENGQLRVSGMLITGGGGYVNSVPALNVVDGTRGYRYGGPPIPIASIDCADGNCSVVTAQPHGFECNPVHGFVLCPLVHVKGNGGEMVARLTGVQGATRFTFFLNGARSATSGTAEYAPDFVSATISDQKWDASWDAPQIVSFAGSGVTVSEHDNSVLDGRGQLVVGTAARRK